MPATHDVFADVNQQLNESIRALADALDRGKPGPELVRASKAQADEGLARLRALEEPARPPGRGLPNVIGHLEIYRTLLDSLDSAPELSSKLLAHLIEEQAEIGNVIAKSGTTPGLPFSADDRSPEPSASTRPAELLPGGRRPLTVGSLIGR